MAFQGDKKVGQSLLHGPEQKLRDFLLPLVPKRVETYHLTLSTVLWNLLIILFCWLAKFSIHWLWGMSVMIFAQYITDLLDGAIGRKRNTGLIKWGYYMDHFLDYLFLCAILIGYAILLPTQFQVAGFYILALFGAFMVNSFLSFAATNSFKIAYCGIGPTEIRGIFILINTLLILLGPVRSLEYLVASLPYVLGLGTFGLFVTVFQTQKMLWRIDMDAKRCAEKEVADTAAEGNPSK